MSEIFSSSKYVAPCMYHSVFKCYEALSPLLYLSAASCKEDFGDEISADTYGEHELQEKVSHSYIFWLKM